jgi:hypothetical protein
MSNFIKAFLTGFTGFTEYFFDKDCDYDVFLLKYLKNQKKYFFALALTTNVVKLALTTNVIKKRGCCYESQITQINRGRIRNHERGLEKRRINRN